MFVFFLFQKLVQNILKSFKRIFQNILKIQDEKYKMKCLNIIYFNLLIFLKLLILYILFKLYKINNYNNNFFVRMIIINYLL